MTCKNTFLFEYYDKCQKGEIVIGLELLTELENLITDFENKKYVYDTAEAYRRMYFMQNCIRLTKSPFYGQPMALMLWQKAWIECFYSFKMSETGFDRFKKTLLLVARKNSKSELCSALALTSLILGNDGSDIVCSSNDDNQASILYEAVDTMRLMLDPKQQDTWRNQRWIRNKVTDSKIFKLSDRTRNKEGRNIDVGYVDECHEMKKNDIVKAIEQSQSLKDNPKLVMISTEGFENDGFLDDELKFARKVINGEEDGPAAVAYLPWLYTQDSESEVWQDPKSHSKSNPALGIIKKKQYIDEQLDKARVSKADRMYVLAKDFNIKQSNAQAWLMEEDYNYDCSFDINDFRDSVCLGAVDLAMTTDLVSAKVLLMRKDDDKKYVYSMYFIPESKLQDSDDKDSGASYSDWAKQGLMTITAGNEVDLALVADWFYGLFEEYNITVYKCGYDQRFSKDFLKRMDYYGFEYELINQNAYTMSGAIKLVEADLRDRTLNYGDNVIDRWCFGNASLKVDNYGNCLLVKIDNMRSKRIDGAVTTAILYETFRRYKSDLLDSLG